jgi:hypothetical protein
MLSTNIKTLGFALATGLALITLSSPAQAYTVYTDFTSWQSALFNYIISTDTFSTPIPSAQSISLASGIISTNSGPITLPNSFKGTSKIAKWT